MTYSPPAPATPVRTPSPLRAHRKAAGLTIPQLAVAAGVSPTTISDLELGKATRARESTKRVLAGALNSDVAALFPPETTNALGKTESA